MKRVILAALCFFLCVLFNSANAYHEELGGSCGDNLTWVFYNLTLRITGKGEMTNFSSETDAPWAEKYNEIEKVEIEEGVTSIGDYAFYNNFQLYDVKIASTVTRIGCFAFSGCDALINFTIPSNISSIGYGAFSDCFYMTGIYVEDGNEFFKSSDGVLFNNELTVLVWYPAGKTDSTYTVPDSVVAIESDAFAHCRATSIILSNGLRSIGERAFTRCDSLTSITIPATVVSIGTTAFTGCYSLSSINVEDGNEHFSSVDGVLFNHNLTTLVCFPSDKTSTNYRIPEGVTSVEHNAFYDCDRLKGIVFPDTVKTIGDYAFYSCGGLTNFAFGNNVSSIGDYALSSCINLKTVLIPKNVKFIGNDAFYSCPSLSSINVEAGNEHFSSVSGVLFNQNHDSKRLVIYPKGKTGRAYSVPDGVTSIGDKAFYANTVLQNLTLGSSVISIGDYAFYFCSALSNVNFSNSLTSIGYRSFYNCRKLNSVTIPANVTSIGDDAFASCDSLTSIDVKDGNKHFKSIDGVLYNFEETSLVQYPPRRKKTTLFIPDGVTEIKDDAFRDTTLESVRIPESVTTIGDGAFYYCLSLRNITIPNNVTSIGIESFYRCSSLTKVIIPDSVKTIGDGAFGYCTQLRYIQIGKGVESIGERAFCKTALTTVTFPKKVRSIGAFAFEYCTSLTSINVEEGNEHYTSIDGVLFNHEQSILIRYPTANSRSTYSVPDGVIEIQESALSHCTIYEISRESDNFIKMKQSHGLENVIIPDSVTTISDGAFGCANVKKVEIGRNVKVIGAGAFSSCGYLTDITIPESVESIGDEAFYRCSELRAVYYLGSTIISSDAFVSCESLNGVCVPPFYESSYFGGVEVNSTSDTCRSFQTMYNHCYKPKCENGKVVDEMRDNASEWVSKTDGCIEYVCDNESGGVKLIKCKNSNTDDITHMCVKNQCVVRDDVEETDKWIVEIDIEIGEVTGIEMNISEVVMMINELAGTAIDELNVGYEIDVNGYVVRIVVYTKDEDSANKISGAVEGIRKGGECGYGVLCRSKTVRVKGSRWMMISSGYHTVFDYIVMMVSVISMMQLW